MPQVSAAAAAVHFDPLYAVGVIGDLFYIFFDEGLPETGPSGAAVEFGIGAEEFLSAADALIGSFGVVIPVNAGKGPLSAFFTGYLVLLGRELFLPFSIGLGDRVFGAGLGLAGR